MSRFIMLICVASVGLSTGCAALTNPLNNEAIPVSRLPAEVLGRPKAEMKPIDPTLLRQKKAEKYKIDKGDVLAVLADEIIAPTGTPAPVKLPDANSDTAALGFPVPVSDDGTINLPGLKPIPVKGLTVNEIEQKIREAAVAPGQQLISPDIKDTFRCSVQLLQPRIYKVTVIREDTVPITGSQGGVAATVQGNVRRGAGFPLRLQEGQNDVLMALNLTGGLPGQDAKNEVMITRGEFDPANQNSKVTRIPLRLYPDQPFNYREEDIVLKDGDIVRIESRETELFHFIGLIGTGEVALPRDRDVDVIEAIAQVRGPLLNGGFTQNQFVPQSVSTGIGNPSPSRCIVQRRLPNNQQIAIKVDLNRALRDRRERILILPGDIVSLQETPGEAFARYLTQTFRLTTTTEVIRQGSLQGIATTNNP